MRIVIKSTEPAAIAPLRHAVLRPNRPLEESYYPTDHEPGSIHLAAFDGDRLIGCASAHVEAAPTQAGHGYRLRGMAVVDSYRNHGIGGRLLTAMEAAVRSAGAEIIWCNGRLMAANFYRRHGWVPVGDEFDLIGIPHLVFTKALAD